MTEGKSGAMADNFNPRVGLPVEPKRQAIVIMGMHRSGTSALSRVLNLLGCEAPKTLVGADEYNEGGYWESAAVKILNDKILESGGSNWKDWRAFNKNWLKTPRAEEFLRQAIAIIQAEYGTAGMFVFKDPRVCRLVPFWRTVFDSLNITMKVVIPIRNPLEVADSLQFRNGLPRAVTLLLWLRHVLEAEFHTRDIDRSIIQYSDLLENWSCILEPTERLLNLYWPRFSPSVKAEISSFLTSHLRHNRRDVSMIADNPLYGNWLAAVYNVLCDWSAAGEKEGDYQCLDVVRQGLDGLSPSFEYIVDQVSAVSEALIVKDKEISYLRGEAGKRADRVDELTDQLHRERTRLDEVTKRAVCVESLENALAEATRKLEKFQSESDLLRSEIAEAQSNSGRLNLEVAAQVEAVRKMESECAQAREEVKKFQIEGERLQRDLTVSTEGNRARSDEIAVLTKAMCDREERIAIDSIRLATLQADVEVGCRVVDALLEKIVKRWKAPPGFKRFSLNRQVQRLKESGLFDADWYLEAYPDVQEAGVHPAIHYLRNGYSEDRDPSIDVRLMRRNRSCPRGSKHN